MRMRFILKDAFKYIIEWPNICFVKGCATELQILLATCIEQNYLIFMAYNPMNDTIKYLSADILIRGSAQIAFIKCPTACFESDYFALA